MRDDMFKVMIVDDSERKRHKIRGIIEPLGSSNSVNILEVTSVNEAIVALEHTQYDLVVLDIHLPLRKEDSPKKDGGKILLETIYKQGGRLKRPGKIVGLTEYDDLHLELLDIFASQGVQLILYSDQSDNWTVALANILSYEIGIGSDGRDAYGVDICIVTALKDIEFQAVLQLQADWVNEPVQGDDTQYFRGTFSRGSKKRSVIAASAIEMGMSAAACLAMKMIYTFKPRYLCMCGITAGIGLKFGDVVIAEQCWDYGSGKFITKTTGSVSFEPAPKYVNMSDNVKEKISIFVATRKEAISAIQGRWTGNPIETALNVTLGPMASGAAVVENEEMVSAIKEHNRKVAAVEMEAYGIFMAARLAPKPSPEVIVAKAVCDFGIPPKTNDYQRYAAFTSSQVLYEILMECLS
jgi:nucleoside phosphorylase